MPIAKWNALDHLNNGEMPSFRNYVLNFFYRFRIEISIQFYRGPFLDLNRIGYGSGYETVFWIFFNCPKGNIFKYLCARSARARSALKIQNPSVASIVESKIIHYLEEIVHFKYHYLHIQSIIGRAIA